MSQHRIEKVVAILNYCTQPRIRSRIAKVALDYSKGRKIVDDLVERGFLTSVPFPKNSSHAVFPRDGFEFSNRHRTYYQTTEEGKNFITTHSLEETHAQTVRAT